MSFGLAHSGLKNQVTILPNFHARSLQGLAFKTELVDLSIGNNAFVSILLKVDAAHDVRVLPRATTSGDGEFLIFEDPTISDDGVPLAPVNYNRKSTHSLSSLIFSNPTVSDDGLILDTELIVGGSGGSAYGANGDLENYWILAPGKNYYFKLINLAGNNREAQLHLDFYEVDV